MAWIPRPVGGEPLARRATHNYIDRATHEFKQVRALEISHISLHGMCSDVVMPVGLRGIGVKLNTSHDVETGGPKPG
jgi:hypothetical protein